MARVFHHPCGRRADSVDELLSDGSAFYQLARADLTMFFMMLVSMLWEATLALPYGWWNYQRETMTGIFIGAWSGLPIEAIIVWSSLRDGHPV